MTPHSITLPLLFHSGLGCLDEGHPGVFLSLGVYWEKGLAALH